MNSTRPENLPETSSARRPARCIGGLLRANLKAHIDGEMSALRNWLVRCHLSQCAECREELRWLRRLGEDMKDIESARPRPELRARILANLPETPPAPGIRVVHSRPDLVRSPRIMPRLALASGLAMLLVFGAAWALKHAPATVQTQKDAASVVGIAGHKGLSRKVTPPAPDVTGVASTPAYVPEEDPNNVLADKLFHERMVELEHEKQMLGQDDWHRLLAQARAVARKTDTTPATEMGIALTVSNIAAVRTHLPNWAKQEGVRLVTNGKLVPESSENAAPPPGRAGESLDNLVAFYVPAERGPAFLGALKHLGQISILPLGPGSVAATSLKNESRLQADLQTDGQRKFIPLVPIAADAGAPAEKVAVAHDKHAVLIRYLVVTVLLQTIAHN